MVISVVRGSPQLTVVARHSVQPPTAAGGDLRFRSNAITLRGTCQLTGDPGDNPAGWTLGMIQLKWISTDWAYYRGRVNGDGSVFLQAARPPARPTQSCRDTITPGAVFIDNNPGADRTVAAAGAAFPIAMTAQFSDAPSRTWPLTRNNGAGGLTGPVNFIREAQTEAHFCTVLSLMSPAGVFQHLKCIYWNVHWQGRFLPTNFANINAPWTITQTGGALGNMAGLSKVIDGAPSDPRFSGIVTTAAAPHCNTLIRNALNNPNERRSNVWANFDVRH